MIATSQHLPIRATADPASDFAPTRVLLVGGHGGRPCGVAGHLEPRGYVLDRIAALPLPVFGDDAYDVVIVALPAAALPQVLDACAALAERHGPALIVLHPTADAGACVRILEAGADDCLLAPHNPREVSARIRAVLRRRARSRRRPEGRYRMLGDLRLDTLSHRLQSGDGREVTLTPRQYRLLTALAARAGEVVSREDLLEHVLGAETESFDRAVDVHVSRLRKRMALLGAEDMIGAYRGVGYRLAPEPALQ